MTAQQQHPDVQSAAAPTEVAATAVDWDAELASVRAQEAARKEPLRLHYLETLAARARTQPESVRRLLQARWAQALRGLRVRLAQQAVAVSPAASTPSPLRSLLDQLEHATAEPAGDSIEVRVGTGMQARPELRSVRKFRKTWSRLSTDKQLRRALDQAPKNAGPINSHMLVLRSLQLMQDIAPDYLNRFITYTDALLHLEQYEKPAVVPSKPRRSRAGS